MKAINFKFNFAYNKRIKQKNSSYPFYIKQQMIAPLAIVPKQNMALINQVFQKFYFNLQSLNLYQQLDKEIHGTLIYTYKDNYKHMDEVFKIDLNLTRFITDLQPRLPTKCQNLVKDKVYICYDCQIVKDGFLCQECFYSAGHHKICRYIIKQLPKEIYGGFTCSCGDYSRVNYRGTCHRHHQLLQKIPTYNNQQKLLQFQKHLIGCFKMVFAISSTLQNHRKSFKKGDKFFDLYIHLRDNYISKLFNTLQNSNKNSNQLVFSIQKCLLTPINTKQIVANEDAGQKYNNLKQNDNILNVLLTMHPLENYVYNFIKSVLQLKNEQLIKSFMENVFSSVQNRRVYKVNELKEIISNIKAQPKLICRLLCQFTQKDIFQTEQQLKQIMLLYSYAAKPQLALNQQDKKQLALIPCWKYLNSKNYLTIPNILETIKAKSIGIYSFLTSTVGDRSIFKGVIVNLISYIYQKLQNKYITKNQTGRKINLAEMCNVLSKVMYIFGKGQIAYMVQFIKQFNIDQKLCFVFYYYFFESVDNITHLNQQSLYLFGVYLNYIKQSNPDLYNKFYGSRWLQIKFVHQKLYDYIPKFLNILIGQQLKSLSKYTSYCSITPQQRIKIQQIQQQKLKQVLYMQKQFPKHQMDKIIKQNLLNFKNSTYIIKNYTKYDKKSNNFVYRHQQKYFNFDGILNVIFSLQQAQNLVFTPQRQDNCFNIKYRKDILSGIIAPILQIKQNYNSQFDVKKCVVIKKNHQYTIYTCFIIIDKIMNGEIKQLRSYLYAKQKQFLNRKLISNQQNIQESVIKMQKLFGINNLIRQEQKVQKIQGFMQQPIMMELNQQLKLQNNNLLSKQQEITSSQIIQISPTKQKVENSKLKKLRQKMNQKRQSFFNSFKQSPLPAKTKQNAQTCMICKQEGQLDNSLFYLGVLKKETQDSQIFSSIFTNQYTANLCMHLIHQKCFLNLCKGNAIPCPLCKVSSNIVFPHQNQIMSQKTRQFMENRLIFAYINGFNQYHPGKCFIFLLKNLISQVLFHTIFNIILSADNEINIPSISKVQTNKKINYNQNLLISWWNGLFASQKDYYSQLLNQQLRMKIGLKNNINDRKQKNPKDIIDQILIDVICAKIMKRQYKQIQQHIVQLSEKMVEKQFNQFVNYIRQFFAIPINYTPKNKTQNRESKKFIDHYFTPPRTIPLLKHVSKSCQKCNKPQNSITFCLLCNKSLCTICQHDTNHGKIRLYINHITGYLQGIDKKSKNYTINIYKNTYMNCWGSNIYGWDDYFDYEICYDELYKGLYDWLNGMKNN